MDAAASITQRGKDGSLTMLAGGTLLVRSIRSRRNRGPAVAQALVGAALVAFGLRRRRSGGDRFPADDTGTIDRSGTGTSEQRAESQQHDVNPRGTSGEPDVEKTAPGEGSVRFTEEQNERMGSEPHLDDPSPEDPRLNDEDEDEDEEPTGVDLSEASLADEASEATGPTPEQAQPTQTEETEPEQSPPEDTAQADESDDEDDGDDEDDTA